MGEDVEEVFFRAIDGMLQLWKRRGGISYTGARIWSLWVNKQNVSGNWEV